MAAQAVLATLRHVWNTIDELGIDAAVVGGLALAIWKYPRATRDVDLLVSVTDHELESLISRLHDAGVSRRTTGHSMLRYKPPYYNYSNILADWSRLNRSTRASVL